GLGVHKGHRGALVRTEGRAGVEAEPAEPQQSGAEHDEWKAVRPHRVTPPPDPPAEDDGEGEAGGTGVDVDRRTTGEVEHAPAREPACAVAGAVTEREDPVRDREVHEGDPDRDEDAPRG